MARILAAKFLNSESPNNRDRAEDMLKKPLSPSGQAPATHFICTRPMRQDEIDRQTAFIAAYDNFVRAVVVQSEETFLDANGLKVVA
jgi:hypothetical protein